MEQGVVEKLCYLVGREAYIKTKTGKECWFDEKGHLIRRIDASGMETRHEYYDTGIPKHTVEVGKYEVFYNENGTRKYKIHSDGVHEFWEYDEKGHLCGWHNSKGHRRIYVCGDNGKVVKWYGNTALLNWYQETGRKLDKLFAGLIAE